MTLHIHPKMERNFCKILSMLKLEPKFHVKVTKMGCKNAKVIISKAADDNLSKNMSH
jgi:hypothetical protein